MASVITLISINILPHNLNMTLAHELSHKEFKCRCARAHCVYTLVADSLTDSYDSLRTEFGKALTITSGFRCQGHNRDVGGLSNSSHTTGHAIDISLLNFNVHERDRLILVARKYFDYVQVYEKFIHCHNEAS